MAALNSFMEKLMKGMDNYYSPTEEKNKNKTFSSSFTFIGYIFLSSSPFMLILQASLPYCSTVTVRVHAQTAWKNP